MVLISLAQSNLADNHPTTVFVCAYRIQHVHAEFSEVLIIYVILEAAAKGASQGAI